MNQSFKDIMKQACATPPVDETRKLPGGLGDDATISELANKFSVSKDDIRKQLEMGVKVEMEHTTDPDIAREIAMDHLTEAPDYYTKLAEMEKNFEESDEEMCESSFQIMAEGKVEKTVDTVPFTFKSVEEATKFMEDYCLDEGVDYRIVSSDEAGNVIDIYAPGEESPEDEQPAEISPEVVVSEEPPPDDVETEIESDDPFYIDLQDILGFEDGWSVFTRNVSSAFEIVLRNGDVSIDLSLSKSLPEIETESKFVLKTVIAKDGDIQDEKSEELDLPILFKNVLADENVSKFFKNSMEDLPTVGDVAESIITEAGETSGLVTLSDGSRRKIYTDKEAFHPRLLEISGKNRDLYQDGGQWYRVLTRALKSRAAGIIPAQYFRPHDTTGSRVYLTIDEFKKDLKSPNDFDMFRIDNWKSIYDILKSNQIDDSGVSVSIDKLTLTGFKKLYKYLTGDDMNLLYKYVIKTAPKKKISFTATNAAEIAKEIRDLIPAYLSTKQISSGQDNMENYIKDALRREIEATDEYKKK